MRSVTASAVPAVSELCANRRPNRPHHRVRRSRRQPARHRPTRRNPHIALVIDAMDLLHTGRFDGFCLVSSDSDFTGLASRIREQGIDVYGFGEQKTPESFRQACRRFIYTENLLPEAPTSDEPDRQDARPASVKKSPKAAAPLIRTAISQLDDEGGWVPLGRVGQRLAALASDFDPRTYGEGKLSDLVEKAGGFESRRTETGHLQIRVSPSGKAGEVKARKATPG